MDGQPESETLSLWPEPVDEFELAIPPCVTPMTLVVARYRPEDAARIARRGGVIQISNEGDVILFSLSRVPACASVESC
jgi:hypothetical protein